MKVFSILFHILQVMEVHLNSYLKVAPMFSIHMFGSQKSIKSQAHTI